MQGLKAEYVPGWDCHGLPIEHKVEQELKKKGKTDLPTTVIRRLCREYAAKWLDVQRNEFKRLGVFGVWEDPYMTMKPAYEAATARELGRFMAEGSVVARQEARALVLRLPHGPGRGRGRVRGPHLARPSTSAFPLNDPRIRGENAPTWTPPSCLHRHLDHHPPGPSRTTWAVAVHPDFDYVLVRGRAGDVLHRGRRSCLRSAPGKFGLGRPRHPGPGIKGCRAGRTSRPSIPIYDRESLAHGPGRLT